MFFKYQRRRVQLRRLLPMACWLALVSPIYAEQPTAQTPEHASEPSSGQRVVRLQAEPINVELPADREWVEVPFRFESSKIVLPMSINGSQTLDVVLDTGASSALMLDPETAAGLEFDIIGQVQVKGAGEGQQAPQVEMARGVRFEIGEVVLEGATLAVMRGKNPMPSQGWQAIVGRQIFENLVVQIDTEAQVLRLADPARWQAPEKAALLPIERERGHVFVRGEVATSDGPAESVRLVIDSGAFHALALDSRKFDVLPAKRVEDATLGRGLGGVIRGDIGRVAELRLGPFAFERVVTRFPEASVADIITSQSHGNLGAEILRRFRVTFNYSEDQMILEPNESLNEPFRFSTAGFGLKPHLTDDGFAVVDDLYAGSPAVKVGLQTGDLIQRINGREPGEMGLDETRRLFEADPGSTMKLDVRRGEEELRFELTLAELL